MIEIRDVRKTYKMGDTGVKALDGVSLKIEAGEFVAIMGASGSGKSTMMHVLGLLDRPDSGKYILNGQDISLVSDEGLAVLRNRTMGFVFQQFHLLPRMSALENVRLPLVYCIEKPAKDTALEALELVGLKDRVNHKPNELSGGQQQRVAIARALVNDPQIIMADEPTGNLDSKSKVEIMEVLAQLHRQGKTIILVTHEKEAASYAKRVITMRDGCVISDQRSDDASSKPEVSKEKEINSDKKYRSEAVVGMTSRAKPGDMDSQRLPAGRQNAKTAGSFKPGKIWEYFKQAVFALVSHKMRSILSVLGVLIGISSVIAMISVGEGAKASVEKQLASLGSNLLMIRPGSANLHGVQTGAGGVTRFTFKDVEEIRKLDTVKRVSASVQGRGQLVYADKNWNTQVAGVEVDYAQMRASVPEVGRFFTQDEVTARAKVVVIGTTVAKNLFGETNPVGETIKINLINFKVIGVLPSKGANAFSDQDDVVNVPVTTAMRRLLGKIYVDTIFVEAQNPDLIDTAQDQIKKVIIKQHRLKEDDDSFDIRNMADIKNAMESTTKTMSLLLGGIAAISLLVGGIGIMNIMLVSVSERTREIGLRKAIGANNHDIMTQFLIEAILMSFLGGILGVLLGSGIAVLISVFAGWNVKVSVFAIVLGTTFSALIGVVFGLWPASKASKLNPIEALRYE